MDVKLEKVSVAVVKAANGQLDGKNFDKKCEYVVYSDEYDCFFILRIRDVIPERVGYFNIEMTLEYEFGERKYSLHDGDGLKQEVLLLLYMDEYILIGEL